jgi:hypothetical protein
MHGVMIKPHLMRCGLVGAYGNGRLSPHAHARAIWVVCMQGWDGSEDHVMLLLLAALGALRAL